MSERPGTAMRILYQLFIALNRIKVYKTEPMIFDMSDRQFLF